MPTSFTLKDIQKIPSRAAKSIMKSHRLRIPKYEMPIRFRPWFLVFTCVIMVILAFLGFTNFSRALPLNDKILHFLCFCIATAVFYFIIDVEESARRIWFWRHCGLIFTAFTCFFCGGVLSEFVQATLPYKEFQWGDVLANLCGSSLGLYISYYLEQYYRHRREIARLYRPVSASVSDFDEEDEDDSADLLPLHNHNAGTGSVPKNPRFANVWDEREELFGFDDEGDDGYHHDGGTSADVPQGPRIVISHP